jgi:anhydro-N-acetylmuramic acid kinase
MREKTWKVLGLMSGTSLDGLDMALCEFLTLDGQVKGYQILASKTYEYTEKERSLLNVMNATAQELAMADFRFGTFCGAQVKRFLGNGLEVDFVSSHGHTIFHQPENGFTCQIGSGAAISAGTGLPVVSDFRSMDVLLGGQGAPLVPIGDLLLFEEYDFCLNLGGIANISIKQHKDIIAYDVCPVNMVLNALAKEKGFEYDNKGDLAKSGTLNHDLLSKLDSLDFYLKQAPKSLGKEYIDQWFFPLIKEANVTLEDKLSTMCHHIASKIAVEVLSTNKTGKKILVTGGGAFNTFLVELLRQKLQGKCEVIVPDSQLVNFKEALVFAFLGLRRVLNLTNSLKSVTGARYDSIGGALYGDFSNLYR